MPLELVTVPCLTDNYAYIVHDAATGATGVIDVPEAAPILDALAARGWKARDILLTHHHDDHIAGVTDLVAATGARVLGPAADRHRLPRLDVALADGDAIGIGTDSGRVIAVPGHTLGHVAYHFPDSGLLFTGDSLMALGCGRVFEGTMAGMWASLVRLAALPPETLVCPGHEYSLGNARFALTVEPDNAALRARAEAVAAARAAGRPTVPSRLAEELATNPFLRAGRPEVRQAMGLGAAPEAEVFAALRRAKDRF